MTVRIKRGDDFRLQMSVKNRRSDDALIAYQTYQDSYEAWRAAVNADLVVEMDVQNTHDIMESALNTYETICEVDITGWEIEGAIAWNTRHVADMVCEFEDTSRGIFTISISKDETNLLKPREYRGEIQFTRPSGSDVEVTTTQDFILIVDADIVVNSL